MEGPPPWGNAPSTAPPASRQEVAAFTMGAVVSLVMSAGPWNSSVLPFEKVSRAAKSDIAAPKEAVDEARHAASLKRCHDTKRECQELRPRAKKPRPQT